MHIVTSYIYLYDIFFLILIHTIFITIIKLNFLTNKIFICIRINISIMFTKSLHNKIIHQVGQRITQLFVEQFNCGTIDRKIYIFLI